MLSGGAMSKRTTKDDIRRMTDCWRRLLALTSWDIVIFFVDELEDGRTMDMQWIRGYTSAGLRCSKDALALSPERAEKSIVHELLHLTFAPVDDRMELLFGHGTNMCEFRQEMERAIDGLSVRLVEAGYDAR